MKGVDRMLGEARQLDSGEGELVEFLHAGATGSGEYRCSGCGYGVTVQDALPQCPMCAGTTWESAAWAPLSRPDDALQ